MAQATNAWEIRRSGIITPMTTVEDIIAQLQGCETFFTSQRNLLAPDVQAQSASSMARSIATQITTLRHLDVKDGARLNTVLAQITSFAEADKQQVASAITNTTMASCASGSGGANAKRGMQTLKSTLDFLCASDWECLQSTETNINQKIDRVAKRLLALGIRCPNEVTIKHSVAAIIATHPPPPLSAQQMHQIVIHFKAQVQRTGTPTPDNYLSVYPVCPAELPQAVYAAAYTATDPPVQRPDLATAWKTAIANLPMRSTNKQLSQATSASSSSTQAQQGLNAISAMLQQVMGNNQIDLPGLVINPAVMQRQRASPPAQHPLFPIPKSHQLALLHSPADAAASAQGGSPARDPTGQSAAPAPLGLPAHDPIALPPGGSSGMSNLPPLVDGIKKANTTAEAIVAEQIPQGLTGEHEATVDELDKIVLLAAGGQPSTEQVQKKPAKDCGSAAATNATKKHIIKKPSANSDGIALGCGKCRGAPMGCVQCRDPNFKGSRWQRD